MVGHIRFGSPPFAICGVFSWLPTCLELGSLSARSTLFPTNLEGASVHPLFQPKNSGNKFPWRVVCFLFSEKKHQWKQKKSKYIRMCVYVYLAEVKKERCTSNQKMSFFFWKKKFNLEDLLVSKRCFFFSGGGCTYFRS